MTKRIASVVIALAVVVWAASEPFRAVAQQRVDPAAVIPPPPAWANQTRAPEPAQKSKFTIDTLASGLNHPWAVQFLPDGRFLITERPGYIRIVNKDGWMSSPLPGLPAIRTAAERGLHDVALDPDFARNRTIYFSYFAPPDGQPGGAFPAAEWQKWLASAEPGREASRPGLERVASAMLSADFARIENVKVILEGGDRRIAVRPDGTLLVTAASRAGGPDVAIDDLPQQVAVPYGKVLRVNRDGSAPKDNPFAGRAGANPYLYAIGLRDPEGATINPQTGDLWTVEHGPMGGDELNRVRPGANLGFPTISYGRRYTGEQFTTKTAQDGLEQPIYWWVPSIGPSGVLFYTGSLIPQWKGNVFVGSMPGRHLVRLVMNAAGDRVVNEEKLLTDLRWRIRDVKQGPDGAIYVLTDEDNGRLLRLRP
jgi:aldose sugar dehydrogenase